MSRQDESVGGASSRHSRLVSKTFSKQKEQARRLLSLDAGTMMDRVS